MAAIDASKVSEVTDSNTDSSKIWEHREKPQEQSGPFFARYMISKACLYPGLFPQSAYILLK
jgi:hypothetical protein